MGKEFLTEEKYKELKEELEYLTKEKRREIARELDTTAALGDLRENAEYQQAREDQANLEARISKIESILKDAEVMKGGKGGAIDVGNKVVVSKKGGREKIEYKIVGAEEADMASNKISAQSPFGEAMLGKKKGDTFSFEAPKGKMEYKIVDVK